MKQKSIELILLSLMFFAISFTANANYDSDLKDSLREAMMNSNNDYMKHKERTMNEEHQRVDDWAGREDESITINDPSSLTIDQENYKRENQEDEQLHELSLLED